MVTHGRWSLVQYRLNFHWILVRIHLPTITKGQRSVIINRYHTSSSMVSVVDSNLIRPLLAVFFEEGL